MKMKLNELKVFYRERAYEQEFEEALIEFLGKFGYSFWAAGVDYTTKIRDLAFDKKELDSGKEEF